MSQHNKLHYIPDQNLRTELYRMGFANQDSLLDESKIDGLLILDELANKEIKKLDGLQYFKQVWWLDIRNNKIEELKYLPPNLTRLDCSGNEIKELINLPSKLERLNCSYNKLETINELPNNLKHFDCSNNLIKKIINLPDNLEFLNFSDNSVETFPIPPSSLQFINYYNNLLDINKLPDLYKNNIPCDHPLQNCLPYELLNWKLFKNNIKDTIFEILALKVTINQECGFMITGTKREKINFIRKDNRLIGENQNIYRTYGASWGNKEPTTENQEFNHSINIEELEVFLKDLFNRKMIFEFQFNDSVETINLKTKRNGYPSCSPYCIDCCHNDFEYEIYTAKDTIILKYGYGWHRIEICRNNPLDTNEHPQDIIAILNSIYIFKLEKLILNREYNFGDFQNIIHWERNYR